MTAPKDKAIALKDSYVDGIINELGGVSDPAVRMAVREKDLASIHAFPEQGKMGAVNDGDPSFYIHGKPGESYKVDELNEYANPVPEGNGGRILMDGTEKDINDTQYFLDQERRKMGGSGDLARLGPRTLEEFNRRRPENRPPVQRNHRQRSAEIGFDTSNLAGAMGMEQGNTAGALVSLDRNRLIRKNDGNPELKIQRGEDTVTLNDPSFANPITDRPAGGGYLDGENLTPEQRAYFGQYF